MTTETPSQAVIRLSPEAKRRFPSALVSTIAQTVGLPAVERHDLPLLQRFLELASVMDLNPLMGEIWLAEMRGRNGGAGRLAIMVGRDGYMRVARRHEDFIDVDADVVCQNDSFAVERKADGTRSISHKSGHPSERGEPLGAYAVLRRVGKPDRYFYAPMAEYARSAENSAWKYTHAMIVKCATSYILRTTYGVSGPVPFDELGAGLSLPGVGDGPGAVDGDLQPLDPAVAPLFARIRDLDATAFNEGELRARTQGATPVQIANVVRDLQTWLAENEPPEADVVEEPAVAGGDEDDIEEVSGDVEVELPPVRDPAWVEADERWATNEPWRDHVRPFFERMAVLEGLSVEERGPQEDDVTAELSWIDDQLQTFGAPLGWRPPLADDEQ